MIMGDNNMMLFWTMEICYSDDLFAVPDALRTKYEPEVEKEEARFTKKAMELSPDETQVCWYLNLTK